MFQFKECEKAIIVGSSRNVLTTANFWKKKDGHAWIMMNQAWKIRKLNNDFDRICTNIEHFDDPKNVEAKEVITRMPKRFGDYRFLDLYTTFKKMYGDFLIIFFFPFLIRYTLFLFNSHILSGFFPKIVYLPLNFAFSTDSKTKLFLSIKKLSIKFSIMLLFLILSTL